MTPAERALLLAVAKRLTTRLDEFKGHAYFGLVDAISAVEAEAAPEAPAEDKTCHTCQFTTAICSYSTWIPGCGWQPKSTEEATIPPASALGGWLPSFYKPVKDDMCPACNGKGKVEFRDAIRWGWKPCPDCNGTGKEKK